MPSTSFPLTIFDNASARNTLGAGGQAGAGRGERPVPRREAHEVGCLVGGLGSGGKTRRKFVRSGKTQGF